MVGNVLIYVIELDIVHSQQMLVDWLYIDFILKNNLKYLISQLRSLAKLEHRISIDVRC